MLKADGSNWLSYKVKVEFTAEVKELIWYLEGTTPMPTDPSMGKDSSWKPKAEEQRIIDAYPEKYDKWCQENGWIKQLLGSMLLDSIC
ncbi:hypothetical protein ID866_9214 [Astraeus odoratus]|nr:hypothetical protein ID866_9214 [Astraeus odoratus]